ncbi:hypothetical protein MARCHEWKA_03520 [Brevundimonas phage vB_BpoS-Marchewka]|uniref:Uncharacterized protein n=1 Tax=Brevundimonas phage vB_BpoS-Marchewka TaxID=2948604 RepID=A0A9E7SR78_9CAUD|nr:hypothetical protein MARCHEWKA_03520 [Brevundimonas phage vB_BpoS-Marchewka]UTC29310.1 hypothetical protein BAMBUS_02280 [Brevundimonas phage vB_BpoS-Bambus]
MTDKGLIAIGAAIALLLVGGVSYMVGNYAGTPTQVAQGRITDIDHRPRRTCGTTTDSNGKSKTKWCAEEWQVEVVYLGESDRRTTSSRPPRWQYEGAPVQVFYNVGRWDKQRMLNRIARS